MTDREFLAAEHALRLLQGEDLLDARRLEATDPAFAEEVHAWERRLAPLLDGVAGVEPGDQVWTRIERALADGDGSNVLQWRRSVRRWRGLAALATAAAAAFAIIGLPAVLNPTAPPPPTPTVRPAAPLLIATLAVEDAPGAVAVTYLPDRRELLVSAAQLPDGPRQDRELWVILAGGTPLSLGVVGGEPSKRRLPDDLAARFAEGATIALSVEPAGGSPTGQPTGPVVASGSLRAI